MGCRWIGWCGLTQEAQAAWAQAILSIIAILAASWLARRDRREDLLRQIDVYVGMLALAADQADADVASLEHQIAYPDASMNPDRAWPAIIAALESAPRHEVPDSRLISVMHVARDAADQFEKSRAATSMALAMRTQGITEDELSRLQKQARAIAHQYGQALEVYNDHLGFAPIRRVSNKFRYWRVLRQHRAATRTAGK